MTFDEQPFMWHDVQWPQLQVTSDQLTEPLRVPFETVVENLERIPRVFIEPDGWLLWTDPQGPRVWQLDGQLHDSPRGLMTVELKVSYAPDAHERVHAAVDRLIRRGLQAEPDELIYQLVRPGIYVRHLIFDV